MKIETLIDEALSLPADLRVRLAYLVLKSLNSESRTSLEEEWREMAKQRVADVRAGKVKTIPGEQVLEELYERYA